MRKIISKHEEGRKKKRTQWVVGGVLIFIMLFSTVGYSFVGRGTRDDTNKINYNGFEFVKQNNFWVSKIGDFYFAFKNNPKQVDKIYSQLNYLNVYSGKPLYVFSEHEEAKSEIYRNLDPRINPIVQRIQDACLNEEECEDENIPIKTCEDNFIIIRESNNTQIIQDENCVFIEAPKENLTKITDEFLFKVLGVEQ